MYVIYQPIYFKDISLSLEQLYCFSCVVFPTGKYCLPHKPCMLFCSFHFISVVVPVLCKFSYKWFIYPYSSGLLLWHLGNDSLSASKVTLKDIGKAVSTPRQDITHMLCFALFHFGCIENPNKYMWFVYLHSLWLLAWHWINHMIAPVPME